MAAPSRTRVRTVLACACALIALATSVACSSGRSPRDSPDSGTQDTSDVDDGGATATTRPGFEPSEAIPNSDLAAFTASDGTALIGQVFGSGKGPGVVLLHASSSDMRSWFPLAQRLAQSGMVVLAVDFRGYGQSSGSQDPSAYPLDVAGAIDFLDDLGNKTVALLGSEVGGTAAVVAAADVPGDIKALALLGSGPKFGPLNATDAAGKIRIETLVYSAGDDGGDDLAGLIQGADLRRTPLPADPKDPAIQDALARFLEATVKSG